MKMISIPDYRLTNLVEYLGLDLAHWYGCMQKYRAQNDVPLAEWSEGKFEATKTALHEIAWCFK